MSNIYLRVPQYVAAFYRGRDYMHPLRFDEPLKFCDFSREMVVLMNGAHMVSQLVQTQSRCYSQRSWQNMMRGKEPGGGKTMILRDQTQWLSPKEVCQLDGNRKTDYQEACDYICIALPSEIMNGGRVVRSNMGFALDGKAAGQLRTMMRNEFKASLLDYFIQDRRYCNQIGINRTQVETLERFLARYDIPVSVTNKERDSMRRMANRWLREAYQAFDDPLIKQEIDEFVVRDYEKKNMEPLFDVADDNRTIGITKSKKNKVVNERKNKS